MRDDGGISRALPVVVAVVLMVVGIGGCRPVGGAGASTAAPAPPDPGPAAAPTEEPAPSSTIAEGHCPPGRLQELLDTINGIRHARGLDRLRPEARLMDAALRHARDLDENDLRGHRGSNGSLPADRATRARYPWVRVGENVASGYVLASGVVAGWMESPPHRENLLNASFREVGLAWVEGPRMSGPIWVLLLGLRADTPGGPPGCVSGYAPGSSGGR